MRKSSSRIKVKSQERQRLIPPETQRQRLISPPSSKKKTTQQSSTQLKGKTNDQMLETKYNTSLNGNMSYENFYKAVMDDKNIEESLMNDMKDDIKLMIESNKSNQSDQSDIVKSFNNFNNLYNYLNTLNKTKNYFDFRVNNEDFKDDKGVLNEKAINFGSTQSSTNTKISNKQMINRFIIDNYIINSKTENGFKIGNENYDYQNLYINVINNDDFLQKINELIEGFTLTKYNDLINDINAKMNDDNAQINNFESKKLINIYNSIKYKYLLITKLSEQNIGYYIINIILINKILDEIDFFEFMMLLRILVIFDKYTNVTLTASNNVSNIIKTADTDNTYMIKDKFFIYFTVISLYKKLFKSESKNKFNLYKLAYESYYIKSLLNEKTSTITRLDNRVKYYNFMFNNINTGDVKTANNEIKNNKEDEYNKGLLHYLNIAAVCLLKDNNIEILYNTTNIKPFEIINNDNKLIEKLNLLTTSSESKELNKKLSEKFLQFISNEFFSDNITINNAGIFEIQLSNTSL